MCISMAYLEAQHTATKNDMDEKGMPQRKLVVPECISEMTVITVGYKY